METYHENGRLLERCPYKNGQRHGLYERYFDNGALWKRWTYKNGEVDGLCEETWENGNVCRWTYNEGLQVKEEKIPDFTPRDEFLKLNNLNPDGTRKEETKQEQQITKEQSTPMRKGRKL